MITTCVPCVSSSFPFEAAPRTVGCPNEGLVPLLLVWGPRSLPMLLYANPHALLPHDNICRSPELALEAPWAMDGHGAFDAV